MATSFSHIAPYYFYVSQGTQEIKMGWEWQSFHLPRHAMRSFLLGSCSFLDDITRNKAHRPSSQRPATSVSLPPSPRESVFHSRENPSLFIFLSHTLSTNTLSQGHKLQYFSGYTEIERWWWDSGELEYTHPLVVKLYNPTTCLCFPFHGKGS